MDVVGAAVGRGCLLASSTVAGRGRSIKPPLAACSPNSLQPPVASATRRADDVVERVARPFVVDASEDPEADVAPAGRISGLSRLLRLVASSRGFGTTVGGEVAPPERPLLPESRDGPSGRGFRSTGCENSSDTVDWMEGVGAALRSDSADERPDP